MIAPRGARVWRCQRHNGSNGWRADVAFFQNDPMAPRPLATQTRWRYCRMMIGFGETEKMTDAEVGLERGYQKRGRGLRFFTPKKEKQGCRERTGVVSERCRIMGGPSSTAGTDKCALFRRARGGCRRGGVRGGDGVAARAPPCPMGPAAFASSSTWLCFSSM